MHLNTVHQFAHTLPTIDAVLVAVLLGAAIVWLIKHFRPKTKTRSCGCPQKHCARPSERAE
jgi:hypothetical protein